MNMEIKSPKIWLEFDFPAGCKLDNDQKELLKRCAAKSLEGGCCPYYFCHSKKGGSLCDAETAEKCAELGEEFYEKYIKKEEK